MPESTHESPPDESVRSLAQQDAQSAAPPPDPAPPRRRARRGIDYLVGPNFLNPVRYERYQRGPGDPLYRKLRIFTTDPVQSSFDGAESVVQVPYEPLELGPSGSLIEVIDEDSTTGRSYPGADLEARGVLIEDGRAASPGDIFFHQQMVYAVASNVIARFTEALGRELSWGFRRRGGPEANRLRIRPHHREDRNAYYDSEHGELRFGYFQAGDHGGERNLPRGIIYTCLSHDIITHEMAHALLDGMRTRFIDPTNPDVLAFHEAFADLVAILQHFTNQDSVSRAIEAGRGKLGRGMIFGIAQQFGVATGFGGPLRDALDPDNPARYGDDIDEPHARGMILVTAVIDAMSVVFERRAKPLHVLYALARQPEEAMHPQYRAQLVDLASKVAGQFLSLLVRAIDYCPPVDISFGEYLRAMLTADRDLVEDDRHGYRDALIAAFGRRHIFPADVDDLSEASLLWRAPQRPLPPIDGLDMASIQFRADPGESVDAKEMLRQAEALASVVTDRAYLREFGLSEWRDAPAHPDLPLPERPVIESIRTIRRVGPDRSVRFGLVAEVLQRSRQFVAGRAYDIFGGATIILGGDGRVRFIVRKGIDRPNRIRRQVEFQGYGIGRRQKAEAGKTALWQTLHRGRLATD